MTSGEKAVRVVQGLREEIVSFEEREGEDFSDRELTTKPTGAAWR